MVCLADQKTKPAHHPSMRAKSRPAASALLVSISSPSPTRLQSPIAPMRRPRPEITFERSPTRSPQLAAPLPAGHSPCTSPPSTSSTCMDGPVPSPHPPRALSHRSSCKSPHQQTYFCFGVSPLQHAFLHGPTPRPSTCCTSTSANLSSVAYLEPPLDLRPAPDVLSTTPGIGPMLSNASYSQVVIASCT